MASASYVERLMREGFKETPFGYVKDISPNRILLVIDPRKNTASERDASGIPILNPHPEEIWQRIVHRGYADRFDGEPPSVDKTLRYVYLGFDWKVHEKLFGEGDEFASTMTDEMGDISGYWHLNANISRDRPIMLEVSRKKVES